MKVILIEGIPGSGKTTTAKLVQEYYQIKGHTVHLFQEGDLHPVDLAWCSVFSKEEFDHVRELCEEIKHKLDSYTQVVDGAYIVAYTQLGIPMKDYRIVQYFEPKEIYGGKVSKDVFMQTHLKLWHRFFIENPYDDIVVFECAYLQNHVNELMLMYDCDENEILQYIKQLIPKETQANIQLLYLDNGDVNETIRRVASERVTTDKSKWDDWIDLVKAYLKNSPYGEKNKVETFEDICLYFEKRNQIERKIIEQLPFETQVIDNPKFDWCKRWERIQALL